MGDKTSKDSALKTAIRFARMYGVAETLQPIHYLEEEAFFSLILQWTKEYLVEKTDDPVAFFERRIKERTEGS